ncbi:hypothetical protein ABZS86_33800 [Streptomyces sp. NPDC005355]|uniref:hypothetical protein n=1 Tax=Streptomyces sp. NPDC005355 TaxID=3157038 RepID=UPI0033B57D74
MIESTPEPAQPATPLPPRPAEPPVPGQPPARARLTPLAAGILGTVIGASAVGAVWAGTAFSHSGPGTFTLTGTFSLTDEVVSAGDGCHGGSGYDDIAEGTSVTVYDAAGDVAATGHLGTSTDESGICLFDVSVDGVPRGEKFYQVKVSHRGKVQLTQKEAEGGEFGASLG